mgnify:CR=1 FL=1
MTHCLRHPGHGLEGRGYVPGAMARAMTAEGTVCGEAKPPRRLRGNGPTGGQRRPRG